MVLRKWSGQDVPSAARRGCSARARKSSTGAASVKCPTCGRSSDARPRITGASAAARSSRASRSSASLPGRTAPKGSAFPRSSRNVSAVRIIQRALRSHSSEVSPHAVMPWPPRITPTAWGFRSLTAAMSSPSWKPGRLPADPGDLVAEALGGQLLTVGRARQRDPRVRVQMVDVRGLDERVHRGVDRRGRASFAVQAVVEGGDHLVLAVHPRVHVFERPYPVQPEHGETGLGQRPEVPARALDPEELGLSTGDRIGRRRLGRGVAAACSSCCGGRSRSGGRAPGARRLRRASRTS